MGELVSPPVLPPDAKQMPEGNRLCVLRPGTTREWQRTVEESCSAGAQLWKMQRLGHQTEERPWHTAKMSTAISSVFTSVGKPWQGEFSQTADLYQLTVLLGRRHKTCTHWSNFCKHRFQGMCKILSHSFSSSSSVIPDTSSSLRPFPSTLGSHSRTSSVPQQALPCWYRAVRSPAWCPGTSFMEYQIPFRGMPGNTFLAVLCFRDYPPFFATYSRNGARVSSGQPVRRYLRHKNTTSPACGTCLQSSALSAELGYPAASTILWSNLS